MTTSRNWNAWIVGAVIALLTAAVAVQGVMLYNVQRNQPERKPSLQPVAESPHPAPAPRAPRAVPARPPWEDWFARSPFDDEWDPFTEMERMREHMMRMFDDSFGRLGASPFGARARGLSAFTPQADVEERDGAYVVRVDLPGAEKGDISVSVEGQTLMISGKTSEVREEKDAGGRLLRQERRSGQFQRAMTLPGPVQSEKMEAKYANGVLTITVPKAEASAPPRRVTIL